MSADLITELSDTAEALFSRGLIWSLRIGNDEDDRGRELLTNTFGEVREELRDRGWTLRTAVEDVGPGRVDDDGLPLQVGTYLAIAAEAPPGSVFDLAADSD